MLKRRKFILLNCLGFLLIWLISCTVRTQPVFLTLSATVTLKEPMTEILALYAQEKPHVRVTYNEGGSFILQQQIELGASVDVFISLLPQALDTLQKKDLVLPETRRGLIKNEIVLVTRKDFTQLSGFPDLTEDSIKKVAIGAVGQSPLGNYTQEVLKYYKIFEPVESKAIFVEYSGKALNYVESGEVDAAIVYKSDAMLSEQIKLVAIAPENSHSPFMYSLGVMKNSHNIPAAKEFVNFLSSPTAIKIFEKYGFKPV